METITLSLETIEGAIKNAKTQIAFADTDYDKNYYRGAVDALELLLEINKVENS